MHRSKSSFLECPGKRFPTSISKRLWTDFLRCRKLYRVICCIHSTSSNNLGVVRVSGSSTRNYTVGLPVYPSSVIYRSSSFSVQVKKEFLLKNKSVSVLKPIVSAGPVTAATEPVGADVTLGATAAFRLLSRSSGQKSLGKLLQAYLLIGRASLDWCCPL